jgi:hypothetical protein
MRWLGVGGLAWLVVGAQMAASGRSYDPAKDFSSGKNPNACWAFGYSSAAVATDFVAFPDVRTNLVERKKLVGWCRNKEQGDGNPSVTCNKATSAVKLPSFVQPLGCLNLHPGPEGHRAVVRFTAPETSMYNVQGAFSALTTTTTDPHVLVNGKELVELKPISEDNRRERFGFSRQLEKGDTLDFAVGTGGNGYTCDSTGLMVTVTPSAAGLSAPAATGSTVVNHKVPELAALRSAYSRQSRLLMDENDQALKRAKAGYVVSLTQLGTMAQKCGELDAVLAIKAEATRHTKRVEPTSQEQAAMPQALLQLRAKYLAELAGVASGLQEKESQALKQYLSELEKLERRYTQRGDIAGAVIIRDERTQLAAGLAK